MIASLFQTEKLEGQLQTAFGFSTPYGLVAYEGNDAAKQPVVNYGTAGFRGPAELLPPLAFRVAFVLLARGLALRSAAATLQGDDEKANPLSIGNLGLCITASHNPSKDNGFKLIDGDGGMLHVLWEAPATALANERNPATFLALLGDLLTRNVDGGASLGTLVGGPRGPVTVQVARDTRPSGSAITSAVFAAAAIINSCSVDGVQLLRLVNHEVMTTPALHNLVFWHRWAGGRNLHFNAVLESCFTASEVEVLRLCNYTDGGVTGLYLYAKSINASFDQLSSKLPAVVSKKERTVPEAPLWEAGKKHIVLDCSNGVGSLVVDVIRSVGGETAQLNQRFQWHLLKTDVKNPDVLNGQCGGDYVQKTRVPIAEFSSTMLNLVKREMHTNTAFVKAASAIETVDLSSTESEKVRTGLESALSSLASFYAFDGDADRIVAFAPIISSAAFEAALKSVRGGVCEEALIDILTASLSFSLIDGNRLSVLFACLVQAMGVANAVAGVTPPVTVGAVQTSYTNGASTLYAQNTLKLTCKFAATGVKHLHPVAEHMGVGLYFEANGHGTMLLSTSLLDTIAANESAESTLLLDALRWVRMLLSQSCGDAIAGLFASELAYTALSYQSGSSWSALTLLGLYDDLPSITDKVVVPDPSIIKNNADESRVISPAVLQTKIDDILAAIRQEDGDASRAPMYRSFVRPSGTEPIVRIYSEAPTSELNQRLYNRVAAAVLEVCGSQ